MSAVSDIIAEMRGEYLEDCVKRLADLRRLCDGITLADEDRLREIESHAHAIKGSAFSFGLPEMSLVCGVWEGHMKRARTGEYPIPGDTAPWLRYLAMYAALVEETDPPRTNTATTALIWAPGTEIRAALADRVRARFADAQIAESDRAAIAVLANGSIGAIVTATETDEHLTPEQRTNLLRAAASGSNTGLLVLLEGSDEGWQGLLSSAEHL